MGLEATSTTSLSSSIFKYREIHGRLFENLNGDYWYVTLTAPPNLALTPFTRLPTDEKHNDVRDMAHEMMLQLTGRRLFRAPIGKSDQCVLDVGTGTGIWAIDVADENTSFSVVGTDLSPSQPEWVPPNCRFEIEDASKDEWTFKENTFHFIHIRFFVVHSPFYYFPRHERNLKLTYPGRSF